MDSRRLVGLLVGLLVLGLAGLLWVVPAVQQRIRAEPVAAWVGVEIAGSSVVRVGPTVLPAGQPFRLYAILAARKPNGDEIYYTDASAVAFGDRRIASELLRPWPGPEDARILWLTLEGEGAFRSLEVGADLSAFTYREFFHPEWGRAWSTVGSLGANHDEQLAGDRGPGGRGFGTQHYQVWIELFADNKAIVPAQRVKSPGWEALEASSEHSATVVAELPGRLGVASRVFGLSQLEPTADDQAALGQVARLYRHGLAFTRLLLLRSMIEASGAEYDSLVWRRVDLQAGLPFGPDEERLGEERLEAPTTAPAIAAGDLLRVGARWVVLYRDSGEPGVLDGQDLCFDFDRGAEVRQLAEVFVGGGDIEWAVLAPAESREVD